MHYVRMLIRGTMRELEKLGRNGVIITKLYGTSDTPTGIAMAIHSGMKEYGPKSGKRLRFVIDLEQQNTLIFSKYKEGPAKWKQEQRKTDSKVGSPAT